MGRFLPTMAWKVTFQAKKYNDVCQTAENGSCVLKGVSTDITVEYLSRLSVHIFIRRHSDWVVVEYRLSSGHVLTDE